jgi:REP element-mobilizing transposase RayT
MANMFQRKQMRFGNYDYSKPRYYFITICVQDRENLFGKIVGADSISAQPEMILNPAGKMIENIYCNLKNEFNNIEMHEFVIMPNHMHGIIQIREMRADIESAPTTLSTIIQSFKRHTTILYTQGVKDNKYPPFNKRIWQRGYYEHIIRDEQELKRIREYVLNNPEKWQHDKYYV